MIKIFGFINWGQAVKRKYFSIHSNINFQDSVKIEKDTRNHSDRYLSYLSLTLLLVKSFIREILIAYVQKLSVLVTLYIHKPKLK